MAGRGRAAAFAAMSNPSIPTDPGADGDRSNGGRGTTDEPRPRGRGALFRKASEASSTSFRTCDVDSKTDVSAGASSSSGASSQGSIERSAASGSTSSRSQDSATSTSDVSVQKKPMGRAALFGSRVAASQSIADDVKSKLTLGTSTRVSDKTDSGFTSTREQLSTTGSDSVASERQPPVIRHGEAGQHVPATANYIRLELTNRSQSIYEYEARFKPQVDSKGQRTVLVAIKWKDFGGQTKIFDGGWRIFSPEQLPNETNVGKGVLRNGEEFEVEIVFKRVKKLDDCKFVLNIILKRIMFELKLVRFGRSDYNPKKQYTIPEYKLAIWPGCVTAVDEFEGGIALYCDASHRVLRGETCLDIIVDIGTTCVRAGRDFKDEVLKTFMDMSVILEYSDKKRIMKIDDIDFNATPKSTFKKGNQDITFIEYYKTQYNIDIQDHKQPMLVHRARRKEKGKENVDQLVYLVPELCKPTGLTDEMRENRNLMKKVAEFTRVGPQERQNALREFIRGIKENEKARQILAEWHLKLPDTTIELTGRILPVETIRFGGNSAVTDPNADWGRAAANNEVLSAVDVENWYILFYQSNAKEAENFVSMYQKLARKLGVKVWSPTPIKLKSDRAAEYCYEIKQIVQRDNKVRMLVIVFPSNRDDRYAAVKKLLNSEIGLANQVIISRTIKNEKNLASVVTKIALQINCKMGGALWGVTIPYQQEGIMFCGVDAYHEKARATCSVIGFVASTNKTCTRWTSASAIHNRGQEITDLLQGLLRDCLNVWHSVNNAFPARIVMFRDGVGDGQLSVVRDHEVPQFYRLFESIKSEYKPMLTYVIVQKRINTKLFMIEQGKHINPRPGFVMDHTITRRDWYDYFLVSQNVRQGTVSPTHFVVVHDSSDMKPDHVQRLAYKMTHLYYNWNGTVRVPAPCQYAHKLAYLVGQHMKAPAHEKLRELLYFL